MASNIPDDILGRIGKRLNTKTGVSRFRAVCKSWRSSLPPFAKQLPLQFPIQVVANRTSFTLTESVLYHLAPPAGHPCERGWLIYVREGEWGKTHHMLHPLSQFMIKQLPDSYPKLINLLEYRVFEVAKVYGLRLRDRRFGNTRVAMSLNLDFPSVMMVGMRRLWNGKLGVDSKKCIQVSRLGGEHSFYEDVIFYQGKFYAVCRNGTAVVVDSSLDVTVIASQIEGVFGLNSKKYLVESSGELLLVHRYWDTEQSPSSGSSSEDSDSSSEDSDFSSDSEDFDSFDEVSSKKQSWEQVDPSTLVAREIFRQRAAARNPVHGEDSSDSDYADKPPMTTDLIKFKVFKLDAEEKQWVEAEAEALRDRILVAGHNRCLSVSTGDFPGCRGSCIYFYDHYNRTSALGRGSMLNQIGVFCLDSGTCLPLTDCPNFHNIFCPPPTWTWLPSQQQRKRKQEDLDLDTNLEAGKERNKRKGLELVHELGC
ncbi:PREDICTED: F-box protein At2g17690-like [Prunus mume]|uniref:F-box protein At2g17690-like n=1 Tax=Prunus mume TaxID=102107 RepID=A0ABM1LVY2_PRUMU|nr:PREDICTED: F-box protein At2g17690-like [Prunus mume]